MRTPRTARCTWLWTSVGVLALACGEARPQVGGETNWMRACEKHADCGAHQCLCGVCAAPCDVDSCASGNAVCAGHDSPAWDELCSSHQDPPLCLPRCVDEACPSGSSCLGGACVPVDAGSRRLLAFPGAEGFGAHTRGGRGGRVIRVTTLAADGPGSLQEALNQPEPRTIVFAVSGVIQTPLLAIPYGNVTVAGQTAPGAGVTIAGRVQAAYDPSVGHIILRHLRVRPTYDGSDPSQFDAIQVSQNHHVVLDHVSAAFGADQTIDLFAARDVTVAWCTIETAHASGAPNDGFIRGIVTGPSASHVSVHHLFCAHSLGACASLAGGPAELVSSHFFDVRAAFTHSDATSGAFSIVSNTFRSGPNSTLLPLVFDDEAPTPALDLAYYLDDNLLLEATTDCPAGNVDSPWTVCTYDPVGDASRVGDEPFAPATLGAEHVPVTVTPATETTEAVLARAGAFPRDSVTVAAVDDARSGTGEVDGVVPTELLAGLTAEAAPVDTDEDGMPDAWESARGLDVEDGADAHQVMPSGYTALEEYLDELAQTLAP